MLNQRWNLGVRIVVGEFIDILSVGLMTLCLFDLAFAFKVFGGGLILAFIAGQAVALGMVYKEFRPKLRLFAVSCLLFFFLHYLKYLEVGQWEEFMPGKGAYRYIFLLRSLSLLHGPVKADSIVLSVLFLIAFLLIFSMHWRISTIPSYKELIPPSDIDQRVIRHTRGTQFAGLVTTVAIFSFWMGFFVRYFIRKDIILFSFKNNMLFIAVLCLPGFYYYLQLVRRELGFASEGKGDRGKVLKLAIAVVLLNLLIGLGLEFARGYFLFWTLTSLLFFGLFLAARKGLANAFIGNGTLRQASIPDKKSYEKPFKIVISALFAYFFIGMAYLVLS